MDDVNLYCPECHEYKDVDEDAYIDGDEDGWRHHCSKCDNELEVQ